MKRVAKEVDVVVTTALIPGKPAPKLVTKEMVEVMKPYSIIVDMASERGGNCELTRPGEVYLYPKNNVYIIGIYDYTSRMAL